MPQNDHPIFDYIFNLTVPGVKLELDRIQEFFRVIGEPWRYFKVVHIAGTNGKGSTAAMVAALLQAAGHRTGLNTSPHLVIPNERIRVDGEMVPDEFIVRQVQEWKTLIDKYGLTFFEVLTALAMQYFVEMKVEFAVLETGLGGRLDATNVVDPDISVITNIDRDHIRILGDSIEEIAGEKAGIIKAGRPVLLSRNQASVTRVIRNRAAELTAPFYLVDEICSTRNTSREGLRQLIDYKLGDEQLSVTLQMLGDHQVSNLATALACLEVLGVYLDPDQMQTGIDKIHWPARMEVLAEDPPVFYDVAHNPGGVRKLLDTLEGLDFRDAVLLAGLNERKDRASMLAHLTDWTGPVGYFAYEGHSACSVEDLEASGLPRDRIFASMSEGLQWAREQSGDSIPICIFGSHYFAGELYRYFEHQSA